MANSTKNRTPTTKIIRPTTPPITNKILAFLESTAAFAITGLITGLTKALGILKIVLMPMSSLKFSGEILSFILETHLHLSRPHNIFILRFHSKVILILTNILFNFIIQYILILT